MMKNIDTLLEEIHFVKCIDCGKPIALYIKGDYHDTGTCNECFAPNSCLRNGFDEMIETDLFDKYNVEALYNIMFYKEKLLKHLSLKDYYTLWRIWRDNR